MRYNVVCHIKVSLFSQLERSVLNRKQSKHAGMRFRKFRGRAQGRHIKGEE